MQVSSTDEAVLLWFNPSWTLSTTSPLLNPPVYVLSRTVGFSFSFCLVLCKSDSPIFLTGSCRSCCFSDLLQLIHAVPATGCSSQLSLHQPKVNKKLVLCIPQALLLFVSQHGLSLSQQCDIFASFSASDPLSYCYLNSCCHFVFILLTIPTYLFSAEF